MSWPWKSRFTVMWKQTLTAVNILFFRNMPIKRRGVSPFTVAMTANDTFQCLCLGLAQTATGQVCADSLPLSRAIWNRLMRPDRGIHDRGDEIGRAICWRAPQLIEQLSRFGAWAALFYRCGPRPAQDDQLLGGVLMSQNSAKRPDPSPRSLSLLRIVVAISRNSSRVLALLWNFPALLLSGTARFAINLSRAFALL